MLILGIDGAVGGTGWVLLRHAADGNPLRRPRAVDLGRFTPRGAWTEARLREALAQLGDRVRLHQAEGELVRVAIELPPPTFRRARTGRGSGKQAQVGIAIGKVLGAIEHWSLEQGHEYPWEIPVSEWRAHHRIVGIRGGAGAYKAAALLDVLRRWPDEVWAAIAEHSQLLTGDKRADMKTLCRPSNFEALEKDPASDVAEALLIAEYGATNYLAAPKGPTRAVRLSIGGRGPPAPA